MPRSIVDRIPESVARENTILPIREHGAALVVAVDDPEDIDTIEKLRFILNRPMETALPHSTDIHSVIDRYYDCLRDDRVDVMDWCR